MTPLDALSGLFGSVGLTVALACTPGGQSTHTGSSSSSSSSATGEMTGSASNPSGTWSTVTTDGTGATTATTGTGGSCDAAEVDALYTKRIEPLLETDRPKSCNQCHLAGVDLSSFVQETPCATFACMSERGLVDMETPEESLILDWIERATPHGLVTEEMIAEEYAGFLAWIEATAACDGCGAIADPCGDAEGGPTPCGADEPPLVFEDPGDCDELTLEAVFRNKTYAWRDRCYPCHFSDKENEAPKWIEVGDCELASLQTMRNVTKAGYIDLQEPSMSLLLLKPLAEAEGGVVHGGHDKFGSSEDDAYVDFLYWIEREAECR